MSTLYELVATIMYVDITLTLTLTLTLHTVIHEVRNWKVWFNVVTVLYRGALPLCSTHYAPGHNIEMLELGLGLGLGFLLCRKSSMN